jgi:pullulanase
MQAVRVALDSLTLEEHGVDGKAIYVYGEGWNFGEVADNQRGVNATQLNIGGTGIGVFNDRIRDAIRGGNPFGDYQVQGFINGLYYQPNGITPGTEEEQRQRLLHFGDQIRIGMAGNLRDYAFPGHAGEIVTGADIDYNGAPAGYTLDPQENIVYASAHDNETLFDIIQYKAPLATTPDERVRMQNLALSIVGYSQGVPFFHAGSELLRSKSFDKDSYNSGDWFNRLDYTYQTNNFGVGLPIADKNQAQWGIQQPLLADPALQVGPDQIMAAFVHMQEVLAVRSSSPLFRLATADEITERVQFLNVGPDQVPGMIVMVVSDQTGPDLDPDLDGLVIVINASPEAIAYPVEAFRGAGYTLHPVLAESADDLTRTAAFDATNGTFTVPGRTAVVFVAPQS